MTDPSSDEGGTLKALGERVRLALETLLELEHAALLQVWDERGRAASYDAACRVVMRLVVERVAKARGLAFDGQPRRSPSEPVPAPWQLLGDASERETLDRVLGDLRDMSSELIGVLYEGLLDYELRRVGARIELVACKTGRKGAGSFYTPPQLSTTTVQRTLEPLIFGANGRSLGADRLLALKLCDPAMGSGSFLVAALRVLSAAVIDSIRADGGQAVSVEAIARLVAQRCLYGVDLDPLAVELARATLWLEVGDPAVPPSFLDHKLRCGDALLGTWRDRFRHYPLLALCRPRPDAEADRRALARRRSAAIREQVELLEGRLEPPVFASLPEAFDTWSALWFWPVERFDLLPLPSQLLRPSDEARAIVRQLRERLRFFHWELEFPDVFTSADAGFDAIITNPPWEIQKPNSKEFFSRRDPQYRSYGKQQALRVQAALFAVDSELEGRWRAYSREFADRGHFVRHVGEPFGDDSTLSLARGRRGAALHHSWRVRRALDSATSDPEHPFRHQGLGDLNSYKMFVELGHALLRAGGQLGMIVPSGLYTDKGTAGLRELLLRRCRWRWLYGFENRAGIFAIHRNFKFCVIVAEKHGVTESIQAAFMRHRLDDWPEARGALNYPATRVSGFCPGSLGILEIQSARDLAVLGKLYENSVLLGDEGPKGWGLRYATEFHTTNDSPSFIARDRAEAEGYRPDLLGCWRDERRVLLPLYEGRMIGQFDFSEKGWVSGKGRCAIWREIPGVNKHIAPQFLMRREHALAGKMIPGPKIAYMRIASSTNSRTMIATYLRDLPAGDSVFFFVPSKRPVETALAVVALFNSFVYDWALRARLGGLNLSEFLMLETPLAVALPEVVNRLSLALVGPAPWFAPEWRSLTVSRELPWRRLWAVTRHERLRLRCMLDAIIAVYYGLDRGDLTWILRDCDLPVQHLSAKGFCRRLDPKGFWRVDRSEPPQLRHSVLTLAAFDDLQAMIAEAGDRDAGTRAFCEQHEGEGWLLPETLRVADLGLARSIELGDADALAQLPVRSRLGPRFYPWQLSQTAAQSWAECERHASVLVDRRGDDR